MTSHQKTAVYIAGLCISTLYCLISGPLAWYMYATYLLFLVTLGQISWQVYKQKALVSTGSWLALQFYFIFLLCISRPFNGILLVFLCVVSWWSAPPIKRVMVINPEEAVKQAMKLLCTATYKSNILLFNEREWANAIINYPDAVITLWYYAFPTILIEVETMLGTDVRSAQKSGLLKEQATKLGVITDSAIVTLYSKQDNADSKSKVQTV